MIRSRLEKNGVIVDPIMMSYKSKFNRIPVNKLENDSIIEIDPKTPHIISPWMKFFSS